MQELENHYLFSFFLFLSTASTQTTELQNKPYTSYFYTDILYIQNTNQIQIEVSGCIKHVLCAPWSWGNNIMF